MKIACLLGPEFEDSEFQKPYDEFKNAGHQVVIVGLESGQQLEGDKGKVIATTEKAISEVKPDEFDALFIPGGHSPDKLRIDKTIVDFAKTMIESNKPVFAICHGPQILLTAGYHKYYKLTAWPTVQDDLKKAQAKEVVDQEVCVDRNLVTSRKPDDIPAFVQKSLELMGSPGGSTAPVGVGS